MAKILVIDTQPCVRELLLEELVDDGYLVKAIGDAELITELIQSFQPDLVLLDLYMKGQDRWDILLDLKKQKPNIPVIIVTAYDRYRENPRLHLVNGYVIKSMYFTELKQKINEISRKGPVSTVEIVAPLRSVLTLTLHEQQGEGYEPTI